MNADFETLFLQVRELPTPEERAAFLDEACAGDADLRRRLEEMLVNADEAVEFFGDPVTRLASRGPMIEMSGEKTGGMVGAYKLLQQIGEGGFGTVWMADQLRPVRRRVALKVIKPGLDTKEIIARFEQERQALALMDHPNIARVYDAGATESGRPYFVMELVRGTRITDYCDENGLRISERIPLFIQVCQAVHHAHQKGIIHRDIKPSNVLVTINDGEPVVKVIDFGVAKATQGSLTDATLFTQFHQMIGTPAYMSPEQAEMTSQDIDTRSDIYSLGVLLYELITGRTPLDAKTMAKGGIEEMRRLIREVTPPRPSARVKTLSAEELTTTAKRRRTESGKLTTTLRGDLDWIAMMCLEKDRKRRYDSAHALALDLQRYLAHGVVTARPPTATYLLGRIMRRHRVVFIAGGAVALSLIAGAVVSTWLFFREMEAREKSDLSAREQTRLRGEGETARLKAVAEEKTAKQETARGLKVTEILKAAFKGAGPAAARGRDTKMLREILDQTAAGLTAELKEYPEVEGDLRITIGEVYRSIGEYPQSEAMHRRALEIAREEKNDRHIAAACGNLAMALDAQRKLPEAEALALEAVEINKKADPEGSESLSLSLNNLAMVYMNAQKSEPALTTQRQALDVLRKVSPGESRILGVWTQNLGTMLRHAGKMAEAEKHLKDAVAILDRTAGEGDPDTITARIRLATLLRDNGSAPEAEEMQQKAVDARRKLGPDNLLLSEAIYLLATMQHVQRHFPDAIASYREALAIRRKVLASDDADTCQLLNDLATALFLSGETGEAEALYNEALGKLPALVPPGHSYIGHAHAGLARVLRAQKKWPEAEAKQREVLALVRGRHSPPHPGIAVTLSDLAVILLSAGRPQDAEVEIRQALEMQKEIFPNKHPHILNSREILCQALAEQGEFGKEEIVLKELRDAAAETKEKNPGGYANALRKLGGCLIHQKKFSDAETCLRECLETLESLQPEHWSTGHARALLGVCLLDRKEYGEAETKLLSGGEIMEEQREQMRGETASRERSETFELLYKSLVRLYTETKQPAKAAVWQKKQQPGAGEESGKKPQ